MKYIELLDELEKNFEIIPVMSPSLFTITDVALIEKDFDMWNQTTLYIGNISNAKKYPSYPIMLFSTSPMDDKNPLPDGSSYAYIKNSDLDSIFSACKKIIWDALKAEASLFKIAQAALSGKNIVSVINTAANLLGNALILVDSNMKVLAYSTNYDIVDPLWKDNIRRGHYSYDFIQKVRYNKKMQEWSKQGSETQLISLSGDTQPKLVTRITHEGHLLGAIIMIEHHTPINHYHHKQLPLIGKILFDTFTNGSVEGVYKSFYSKILYNLLDEEDIEDTLELMSISKTDFPKEMQVVVARFIHRIENRYVKRTVGTELEHIFPKGYLVQYKNYISILVHPISKEEESKLLKLAKNEDINIGISWVFTDILEFKKYFKQAVSSIKQGQSFGYTNTVFNYTDFAYYDLLFHYTGKVPLQNYCHPALKTLREYDQANNTQLYTTLRTYLNCNKNLKATADLLFLHRNSLTYRINRINELTGLDLNNTNVVYSLIDSFRIEEFLASISKDLSFYIKK